MTNREKLIEALNSQYITDELCDIFYKLAEGSLSKGDLMRIVYSEDELKKVDSAYPQDYADRIRVLNPNFNGNFMVYDYNQTNFGSFKNVAELLVEKIIKSKY